MTTNIENILFMVSSALNELVVEHSDKILRVSADAEAQDPNWAKTVIELRLASIQAELDRAVAGHIRNAYNAGIDAVVDNMESTLASYTPKDNRVGEANYRKHVHAAQDAADMLNPERK